jgi:hypothetical protein
MSITITSTTDSKEAVDAALGSLAKEEKNSSKKTEAKENLSASESAEESVVENDDEELNEADESEELKKESKEDKPKKKGGFKRKIDKLNAKISAFEQEMAYWKAQAQKGEAEEKPEIKTKSQDERPKAEDYETHEEYVEALADYKIQQRFSEKESKQKEADLKTQHQKQVETHLERVSKFVESHSDFEELMEEVDDIPMSLTVQQLILESEIGPELMYELAKNREEYEKICKLPSIAAARELGKIEARLNKPASSEPKKTLTKAPKPISPVGTRSANTTSKNPDEMSFQEYKVWRASNPNG